MWGLQEGARGEAALVWVWGVRGWALFHARPPVLGACGRGPLPTGCECGGFGRGKPSTTPQRALLRAGFARCGSGTRAPKGGGVSCLDVGRPWLGALPHSTARAWGVQPGPATHWLWVGGVWAWGPLTNPTARACELDLRALGAAPGRPGGGLAPGWGVQGWVLFHAGPPVLWACGGGPATHLLSVRGGVGVGTRHQPDSARSCELALRAVRAAQGRPGRGLSCLGVGRPE